MKENKKEFENKNKNNLENLENAKNEKMENLDIEKTQEKENENENENSKSELNESDLVNEEDINEISELKKENEEHENNETEEENKTEIEEKIEKLKENQNLNFENDEETEEENENEDIADSNLIQNLEEKETETTVKKENKNKKKKALTIILCVLLLIILVLGLSFYLVMSKTKNNKILSNIYYKNLNLGGKTKEEAEKEIKSIYEKDANNKRNIKLEDKNKEKAKEIIKKQIELGLLKEEDQEENEENKESIEEKQFREFEEIKVSPKDLEFEIDAKNFAEEAYNVGREENLIYKAKQILKSILNKKIKIEDKLNDKNIKYKEETLNNLIIEIDSKVPGRTVNNIYSVVEDKLIITRGQEGLSVNKEKLSKDILNNFKNPKIEKEENKENKDNKEDKNNKENKKEEENKKENNIVVAVENKKPEKIDIEKIYNEVKKEVKDASFNYEERRIEKEQDGVDFAISIEEAKKIVEEEKEKYEIPLKITKPKVTTSAFLNQAFPDVLASYTTNAAECSANRAVNLAVASNTINGTVINPGEVFSFNGIIGWVSTANGYRPGGVYTGGGVTLGVGGGICQVVSTIYNVALMSGMDIVERHQHSYLVDYVPAGRDATMYIPSLDLKFRNSLSRPIKIFVSASGGTVSASIRGVDEGVRGEVAEVIHSSTPAKVVRVPDPNLYEGEEKRSGYALGSASSSTYYKLWKNGKLVKNELIHSDYYRPTGQFTVRYGTKKREPAPAPKPEPAPTPKPEQKPEPTPTPKPEEPKGPKEPEKPVSPADPKPKEKDE